jgi:uroporphyrinogen-III synthase
MPEEYVAESLVKAFASENIAGKKMLLPRAAVARDVIPEELKKLGAKIDVVDVYRNVVPLNATARARELFSSQKKPDWLTFTSSSTVKNLLAITGLQALEGVRIASIGPITSSTLCAHGLKVDAEAKQFTIDGLIDAILATYQI